MNIAISIAYYFLTSIYTFQFQNTEGGTINMNNFQQKKILLVNIASGSNHTGQLAGLQQLQNQFADSLVIIAFPSNSFGNEPKTNAEIKQDCVANYNATFLIAAKSPVFGTGIHPIYDWLSKSSENGEINLNVGGDFQKILIAKDGTIQAIFSPKVEPMHADILQAIVTNY